MENRLAQDQTTQAVAPAAGGDGREALRRYEFLFEMTTQLLAAQHLEEQISLVLDAVTAGLGFPGAAIALIDKRGGSLRVRGAEGFTGDSAGLELPLDSNAPHVRVVHDGRPAWITREDEEGRAFLEQTGSPADLLALPLFGGQLPPEKHASDITLRPGEEETLWPATALCMGVLYVAAPRGLLDDAQADMLARFAERVGVILSSTSQTERLAATVRKLQRERQWVESIMKSVADPIVLTNMDNEILLQNRRAEELFSDRRDASEGKRRALEMNDLLFSAYLSSAAVASKEVVGRDLTLVDPLEGSDIHFEVISTPALNARGERIGLVSIFRDVTDLRRANEELARNFIKLQQTEAEARRERDRLDLILENVGHPIAVCDSSGKFILFNRRAEIMFEEREGVPASSRRAVRNNSVKLTSFISALASGAETGRQAEIELIDPETGVGLPMEITSAEVLDATGQVRPSSPSCTTSRRYASSNAAASSSSSSSRKSSRPSAASPRQSRTRSTTRSKPSRTRSTSSRRERASSRTRASSTLRARRPSASRTSSARCSASRAARARSSGWTSNQILEETLILVEKKMKQTRVEVAREFDAKLPKVRARADQLRQVFLNLLLNAQQAMEKGGRITIKTSVYQQALQPTVSVRISDTGRGIPEAEIPRIFEPFFSTRTKGTGLGLWVTQDIVRHHGGRIEVTSEEGAGTNFDVILPVDSPTLTEADAGKVA